MPTKERLPVSGHAEMLRSVGVAEDENPIAAVVVKHRKGAQEAWCIATSRVDLGAQGVVKRYAKRLSIEETFLTPHARPPRALAPRSRLCEHGQRVRQHADGTTTLMLIIRRAQMAAFAAVAMNGFEERLVAWLVTTEPARCGELGDDGLRAFVHAAVAKAKAYGIEGEADVAAYVALRVRLGPRFDEGGEHAWAGAIFARAGVPAAIRIERVEARFAAIARRSAGARAE